MMYFFFFELFGIGLSVSFNFYMAYRYKFEPFNAETKIYYTQIYYLIWGIYPVSQAIGMVFLKDC